MPDRQLISSGSPYESTFGFSRAVRVVVLGVALITGALVRPALWVLAVLTMLTALQRLYLAVRALHREAQGEAQSEAPGEPPGEAAEGD